MLEEDLVINVWFCKYSQTQFLKEIDDAIEIQDDLEPTMGSKANRSNERKVY